MGPGYDCLGAAVTLYLEAHCVPAPEFRLELTGEGANTLPHDASNLVVAAMLEAAGVNAPPKLHLQLNNDIPLCRGLGSSSAAAVAGAALGLWVAAPARRIDRQRVFELATRLEGHADNAAPATFGGLIVSGNENGAPLAVPRPWPDALEFATVVPAPQIPTPEARGALPASVGLAQAAENGARLARLLTALDTERYELLRDALQDHLHQPYRLPLAPGLTEALTVLHSHPRAWGAYLSGSGSTLCALVPAGAAQEVAAAGVDALAERGVSARALALSIDRRGLTVASDGARY